MWPKSEAPQWPPRGRFRIKTGSAARLIVAVITNEKEGYRE
jgi:hypothetical protein